MSCDMTGICPSAVLNAWTRYSSPSSYLKKAALLPLKLKILPTTVFWIQFLKQGDTSINPIVNPSTISHLLQMLNFGWYTLSFRRPRTMQGGCEIYIPSASRSYNMNISEMKICKVSNCLGNSSSSWAELPLILFHTYNSIPCWK